MPSTSWTLWLGGIVVLAVLLILAAVVAAGLTRLWETIEREWRKRADRAIQAERDELAAYRKQAIRDWALEKTNAHYGKIPRDYDAWKQGS